MKHKVKRVHFVGRVQHARHTQAQHAEAARYLANNAEYAKTFSGGHSMCAWTVQYRP